MDQYNLRLGAFWLPALGRAIAEADAFLLLLGSRGPGDWQLLEYYEALDRKVEDNNFAIVPVLTGARAPGLPFLRQLHWIETPRPQDAPALTTIVGALKGDLIEGTDQPWRTINPYRGLLALEEPDAEFFFGRNRETASVIDAIAKRQPRIITLIGNSGVGKSSLVQAGVIGSLRRERLPGNGDAKWISSLQDSRAWAYVTMKPGENPIRALAGAFTSLWFDDPTDANRVIRTSQWEAALTQKGNLADLVDATQDRFKQLGIEVPLRVLLYVDQGEELYAYQVRSQASAAANSAKRVAAGVADKRVAVITAQRSDFYGYLQSNRAIWPLTEKIDLPPLGLETLDATYQHQRNERLSN